MPPPCWAGEWGVLPWGDTELARRLGLDRPTDFDLDQGEAPDLALWVGPHEPAASDLARLAAAERTFASRANRLSDDPRPWPGIATVAAACERPAGVRPGSGAPQESSAQLPPPRLNPSSLSAVDLIRQRRSAQVFDSVTSLSAGRWFAILDALLPRSGVPPLNAWGGRPRVHLALFIHRVLPVRLHEISFLAR